MADIRVFWDNDTQLGDIFLKENGSLDGSSELQTAVIISLATDRTAELDDDIPDWGDDRRGWWADFDAESVWDLPDPLGSRLWLLKRSKLTDETLNLAEQYAHEALQWFVDLRVATNIEIAAERLNHDKLALSVRIFRGPTAAIDLQYKMLWNEI